MRLVSRSTISLPVPSLVASLKSGMSDSSLALANGPMIFLLISGFSVPLQCFSIVLRYPVAIQAHDTQLKLSLGLTSLSPGTEVGKVIGLNRRPPQQHRAEQ